MFPKKLDYIISNDYPKYRQDMLDLHRREYGEVPAALYDSLYVGNPYGKPILGLCFDGGELVGQENYILQPVACKGSIHRCALGINTIVDPRYRLFHGIFGKLVELTADHLKSLNTVVLGTYPNELSKKYYLKYFGWKIASTVLVYKKIIGRRGSIAEKMLGCLRKGRISRDLKLVQVIRFDSILLENIIRNHLDQSTYTFYYKTTDFLNWKYLGNKHYNFKGYYIYYNNQIIGYVILLNHQKQLVVADFLISGNNRFIFKKMIETVTFIGMENDLQRIVVHATPCSWYLELLIQYVFLQRWRFDYITVIINRSDLSDDWIIHSGDFDII